jgi:hypothetical protein
MNDQFMNKKQEKKIEAPEWDERLRFNRFPVSRITII